MRCPRCIRGRLFDDDGRIICHLCSHVALDEPSTVERMTSNAANEQLDTHSFEPGAREPGDIAEAMRRACEWGAA